MSYLFKRLGMICLVLASQTAFAADLFPGELSGGGVRLRFDRQGDAPAGSLEFNGEKYPFTGNVREGELVGSFKAGPDAFPFTLSRQDGALVLESDGHKYLLNAPKPAAPAENQPVRGQDVDLLYQPGTLVDPTSTLEVATLLVPKGWKMDPGVLWRAKNAQFVTLRTSVFDPERGWAARWIPLDQFAFNPTMFANARQQGAAPFSTIGVEYIDTLPHAQQYVQDIVLPRYRKIPGLKLVAAEELPAMVQAMDNANANTRALYRKMGRELAYSAARVRVEYPGPAHELLEEDIYCVLNCSWDPQGIAAAKQVGLSGEYFFTPDQLYSYTAPKGQLDTAAPYLQTIHRSMRSTARWHAFVLNIQGAITHIALDRTAMEEAARKAITASQQKSVEESWKSADQQSRDVGALLSNTQARSNPNNPNGPPINGPAGKNSWTNPRGEWRHLPPNEDPNQEPGSTGDWKMAKNTGN